MIALENGELALASVAAARQDYNVRAHVDPAADFVPTLNEVTTRFRRLQTGKAVGADHFGGELYRTFRHELAGLVHPIAKAALRS